MATIKNKILIDTGHEDNLYWMIDPEDIKDGAYWTGDERIYAYDEQRDEMNSLCDVITTEDDNLHYYERVNNPQDDDNVIWVDGDAYIDVTDDVCFDCEFVTLCWDIKSEQVIIKDPNNDIYRDTEKVSVEYVDFIPQDYPTQNFVGIYRGSDEDGRPIEIRESHPMFASDYHPVCEITYLDDKAGNN